MVSLYNGACSLLGRGPLYVFNAVMCKSIRSFLCLLYNNIFEKPILFVIVKTDKSSAADRHVTICIKTNTSWSTVVLHR